MRYTYLIIDGLIILVPLLYSADRRIRYYRCFPALALSIAVVGLPYIAWDALVTRWGEWSFNGDYLVGLYVFNLPIEEVLFFVTVPFSCLFIYESVAYYSEDRTLRLVPGFFVVMALILGVAALVSSEHGYTMKALLASAVSVALALIIRREFLVSVRTWIWLGICYIPFLLLNSVLTALPVVEYNPGAILGPRIGSIPVEDFFYNFSMLSLYALFYLVFKDWLRVNGYERVREKKAGSTRNFAASTKKMLSTISTKRCLASAVQDNRQKAFGHEENKVLPGEKAVFAK